MVDLILQRCIKLVLHARYLSSRTEQLKEVGMFISEREIKLIQKQDGFDREKFVRWWKEMEEKPISYGKEKV